MTPADVTLLESAFRTYYFSNFEGIHVPSRAHEREFGYQKFGSGMIRHLSVPDDKQLRLLIANNNPSDIYCSNGYYLFPNLPMAEKEWQRADLIFDIDAKDLGMPCREDHTCTSCTECGLTFQGLGRCTECDSTNTSFKSVTCDKCIAAAGAQAARLSSILQDDFGIDSSHMETYFSGNEGFHMHVAAPAFADLGSRERADMVDYIMLKNIMPQRLGMSQNPRYSFPQIGDDGMRGRIARALYGTKKATPDRITEIKKAGENAYGKTLEGLAAKAGAIIDPGVTTDIHRIFRLPGSINSKSGLAKVACDNQKFNPYVDACVLGDTATDIRADCPVRFTLKRRKFGPYREQVRLPLYAACYLICKGFATTV